MPAKTYEITNVDVLSAAKVVGLKAAIVGFIIGILIALGLSGVPIVSGFGWLVAVILPIELGILGFIFGGICAALYNLVVRYTGGIKMEMK